VDVDELVAAMTLAERCRLTAGHDGWSTVPVERLGIPGLRMTDGPNGARGSSLLGIGAVTAACVPCGSALGATWDPDVVERVGVLIGEEARTKGCRLLLGPTVNLPRSPLGGRAFEAFSEDPVLTGRLAAAYVRGIQSRGVGAVVKHLVGNDSEFERRTVDSQIDAQPLRDVYLLPFHYVVTEADVAAVMTAYNRLNGTYCADHAELIGGILRDEWGFDGVVMSDWRAHGTTTLAAQAGLDLEMPGPALFFGHALQDAVERGAVEPAVVEAKARRLLRCLDRWDAFDEPGGQEERSIDDPRHRRVAREAAVAATVLLANAGGLLPLDADAVGSIAVVGPNAGRAVIMGGGSAKLRPHYAISPLDGLRARLGDAATIVHRAGVDIRRTTPPAAPRDGFAITLWAGDSADGVHEAHVHRPDGALLFFDDPAPGVPYERFAFHAAATVVPEVSGPHRLTAMPHGDVRLSVDGRLVIDATTAPPRCDELCETVDGTELVAVVELVAGRPVDLRVELAASEDARLARGVVVGLAEPADPAAFEQAVAAARECDVAVVVVGTDDEWETEGRDRTTLDLPGRQDELVRAVVTANPRTIVVVNAGAPVRMPWADDAAAVVCCWFAGQELGNALAEVLFGDADPGGRRLPVTFPREDADGPARPGSEHDGRVRYDEGLLIGHRWYEAHGVQPRFPFGHGLSYTDMALGAPVANATHAAGDGPLTVDVPVRNVGPRAGSEVVQCYVTRPGRRPGAPQKELRAFAKVHLDVGATATARLALDDWAWTRWDTERGAWAVDAGHHLLHVGRSSADIAHVISVEVTA
jgi:beta-glucosidase